MLMAADALFTDSRPPGMRSHVWGTLVITGSISVLSVYLMD